MRLYLLLRGIQWTTTFIVSFIQKLSRVSKTVIASLRRAGHHLPRAWQSHCGRHNIAVELYLLRLDDNASHSLSIFDNTILNHYVMMPSRTVGRALKH